MMQVATGIQAVRHEDPLMAGSCAFPMVAKQLDITRPAEKHTHDFLELAFILRGRAMHMCAVGSERLSSGTVVLTGIAPGTRTRLIRRSRSLCCDSDDHC